MRDWRRKPATRPGSSRPAPSLLPPRKLASRSLNAARPLARCFGLEVELLTPGEVKRLWPLAETSDLVGAVFLPKDGQTNPVDTTQALARGGAKSRGAKFIEHCRVSNILTANGQVRGVMTEAGEIRAEVVVNCGGMWAWEIGGWVDATVPLHATPNTFTL